MLFDIPEETSTFHTIRWSEYHRHLDLVPSLYVQPHCHKSSLPALLFRFFFCLSSSICLTRIAAPFWLGFPISQKVFLFYSLQHCSSSLRALQCVSCRRAISIRWPTIQSKMAFRFVASFIPRTLKVTILIVFFCFVFIVCFVGSFGFLDPGFFFFKDLHLDSLSWRLWGHSLALNFPSLMWIYARVLLVFLSNLSFLWVLGLFP